MSLSGGLLFERRLDALRFLALRSSLGEDALLPRGTLKLGAQHGVGDQHSKVEVKVLVVLVVAGRSEDSVAAVAEGRRCDRVGHPECCGVRMAVGERRAEHHASDIADDELKWIRVHASHGRRCLETVVELVDPHVEDGVMDEPVRPIEPDRTQPRRQ